MSEEEDDLRSTAESIVQDATSLTAEAEQIGEDLALNTSLEKDLALETTGG